MGIVAQRFHIKQWLARRFRVGRGPVARFGVYIYTPCVLGQIDACTTFCYDCGTLNRNHRWYGRARLTAGNLG